MPLMIVALAIWALANREPGTDPGPGVARPMPPTLTLASYGTLFEDQITMDADKKGVPDFGAVRASLQTVDCSGASGCRRFSERRA